jgi:hypothetical protein
VLHLRRDVAHAHHRPEGRQSRDGWDGEDDGRRRGVSRRDERHRQDETVQSEDWVAPHKGDARELMLDEVFHPRLDVWEVKSENAKIHEPFTPERSDTHTSTHASEGKRRLRP